MYIECKFNKTKNGVKSEIKMDEQEILVRRSFNCPGYCSQFNRRVILMKILFIE